MGRIDPYGLYNSDDAWYDVHLWLGGWEPSQGTVDGVAGFGDGVSLGLSKYIRQQHNIGSVDYCDSAYGTGKTAGHIYDAAALAVVGAPYVAPYIPSAANVGRALFLAGSLHVADPANLSEEWGPITEVAEQVEAYTEAAAEGARAAAAEAGAQIQMFPP